MGINPRMDIFIKNKHKQDMVSDKKLSVRLTNNQMLVLGELSTALNVSISVLLRAIVLDFLTRNQERLDRIIDGQAGITEISELHNANDKQD